MPEGQFYPATIFNNAPEVFGSSVTFNGPVTAAGLPVNGVQPSGDTSGGTDTNTIQAMLNSGTGVVTLASGNYYVTGLTANIPPQYIIGAGWQTVIYLVGTGDAIRMYNPVAPPGGFQTVTTFGGGISNLMVSGKNAGTGAASSGIHCGDTWGLSISNVFIRDFTASGSIGLHLDNTVFWTEKSVITAHLWDNTTGVVYDVNGGQRSFEYNDHQFFFSCAAGQQGMVVQNGAYLSGCFLRCRGNFNTSSTPLTTSWLSLTGNLSGNYSHIANSLIDVSLETNNNHAYSPQTIVSAAANNNFLNNTGVLTFIDGWSNSSITVPQSSRFSFTGTVIGDSNLVGIQQVTSLPLLQETSNTVGHTMPRFQANSASNALTSGTLTVMAMPLPLGVQVNNLTFCVRGQAAAAPTHGWYALLDNNLVVQGTTADQGTVPTWNATNTSVTLPLSAPYTTTYNGLYYAGIMVTAGTTPTLAVSGSMNGLNTNPVIAAISSTAQTSAPALGSTMATLSGANGFTMYAAVS